MRAIVVRKNKPLFLNRHKLQEAATSGGKLHVHKLAEDLEKSVNIGGSIAPRISPPTEHLVGRGKPTERFQKIMSIDDMKAKPIGKIY